MRKPIEYNLAMQEKIKQAIMEKHSKIEGKKQTLEVKDVYFGDLPSADDYARHKDIINNRRSEGINIYGNLVLKDNLTNKVIDEKKKIKLGFLPTITNRHSVIVNGKEYVINNQLRLRPAIYTKVDRNGQPIADFNLAKGANLNISYQADKQQMMVKVGGGAVPLYTFLKDVYKVPDSTLVKTFGSELHTQEIMKNEKKSDKYLNSLHEKLFKKAPTGDKTETSVKIQDYLNKTVMDPETNKKTLGKAYDRVNAENLLHAAKEVMDIYKGKKDPTWKDNLAFKAVYSGEDFLYERLAKPQPVNELQMKLKPRVDKAKTVTDVGLGKGLDQKINKFFRDSDLVNFPLQVNPMEFLENAHKITSMGEGGVQDTNSLPMEARNLHLSQLGFIDPVRTPDNLRAGVDLRMTSFAYKNKDKLRVPMQDKNGKPVIMGHTDLYEHVYTVSTEPKQPNGLYRAMYKGKMVEVPKSKIEYYIPADSMFTVTTASIPYIKNTQGQRNAMGAKMTTQALSLVDRELPLVDTKVNQLVNKYYTPKSPVDGVITKIDKDFIVVSEKNGTEHKINIPHNFALNYHSYLHVDPKVKIGQKVKKGELLGDNNFTKDGKTALGVNAKVVFMPYRGLNYEDGFVITESGAKKFTSQHIFQEELDLSDRSVELDMKKYVSIYYGKFSVTQLGKLSEGVIKKGQKVEKGDPLILSLRKRNLAPELLRQGSNVSKLIIPYKDNAIVWNRNYPGEVIDVIRMPQFIKVVIKALAPMEEGDKIASRYGSKGVVTKIVPDIEAPRFKDGSVPDVLINPAAVPSRMNLGQIFETQMAKVLAKKGKRIEYDNLNTRNTYKEIESSLKKAKLKDTDDLYDPISKTHVKDVFSGVQYFMKLAKQTETNFSHRAGGDYSIDMVPVKGGEDGAKSIGTLDMFALLGHNVRKIMKEKAVVTSQYNPEFWAAVLSGQPIPPGKPTFTYQKNMEMLRGLGANVTKKGDFLEVTPFTDKAIKQVSKGAIADSKTVTDKEDPVTGLFFRPEKNGLFDPAKTGGLAGKDYAHIELETPHMNRMAENPVRTFLDLKKEDLYKVLQREKSIKVKGKEVTGAEGIQHALKQIDVSKELKNLRTEFPNLKTLQAKDTALKKMKYLKALQDFKIRPEEAYFNKLVPVIPPIYRPIYPDETGKVVTSDANHLYRNVIESNKALQAPLVKALGKDSQQYKERLKELYSSIDQLHGLQAKSERSLNDREPAGFLDVIKGKHQPKYGYFQHKVMSKPQDLVARGTIAVDPKLGMDECSIPEETAWTLYGPFIIGNMVKYGTDYAKAVEEIDKRTPTARSYLMTELARRPVILNRAPSLHKFSMLAFWPKINPSKTTFISPLIVKGFNADFDGDTMTIHPVASEESIMEAKRMLPSQNLFNPKDKRPMHVPDQESIMGLHLITKPNTTKVVAKFKNAMEAKAALKAGKIKINDLIEVG